MQNQFESIFNQKIYQLLIKLLKVADTAWLSECVCEHLAVYLSFPEQTRAEHVLISALSVKGCNVR